jgi:hypothetical protein
MRLFGLLYCFFVALLFSAANAEQIFDTHVTNSAMDTRSIALVDTITGKDRVIEVNTKGELIWSWNFPSGMISGRSICKGAGIEYNEASDSFIVIAPHHSAIEVYRDGSHRVLARDPEIDHDFHVFDDGSILFARGFVDKGDENFAIHDKNGKKTWSWKADDHLKSREKYWGSSCKIRENSWKKKGNKDWAHANGISIKDNGNFIFSLRNFNSFFEINPNSGRIVKEYAGHVGVHEPTPYKDGFVLGDRNCTGSNNSDAIERQSIRITDSDGIVKKRLLESKHLMTRGIEVLPNGNLFITTASTVMEIDANGKIFFKAAIKGQDPNIEATGRAARKKIIGRCKWKTLYKAVRTK